VVTQREQVVRGAVASEHIVQLFDGPETLGHAVANHLVHAFERDGHALVVSRPGHFHQISHELAQRGYVTDELLAAGRMTVLDARTTLRQFMHAGAPNPRMFDSVVGAVVRDLASRGPLVIYGEMVDLLAEERSFTAAEELEALWNSLAEKTSFSLLCGYASSHFAAPRGEERLRRVCANHTRVHQNNEDLLGSWLISSLPENGAA
jgi:hypothetical protein